MATTFSIPKSPSRSTLEINNFLGVDLTNTGSNVSETRSPNAPNMIRDVPGKVRKRMGYATKHVFNEGSIYGAHVLKNKNSETIYKRNLCKTKVDIEKELDPGEEFYFFADECIPVGSKIHIQFVYNTDGAVDFAPYITSKTWKHLDSLNSNTSFYANYDISETTNAFVFKNVSTSATTITLTDTMIYFVEQDEGFNSSYSSYSEISELRLYMIGSETTTSDYTDTASDTHVVTSPINATQVKGCVLVQAHIEVTGLTPGNLKTLEVTFESQRFQYGSSTAIPSEVYPAKVFSTSSVSGYEISCIVDPTEDHTTYDDTLCYISGIKIKVDSTQTPFTATVNVTNQKIKTAVLKQDLDENDYIRLVHVGNCMYQEINGVYSLLSEEMNKSYSRSWQNENKLFIIDGQTYHVYNRDDQTFINISNTLPVSSDNSQNIAYVPIVTISKSPEGGGVSFEDLNLLTPAFMEWFTVDNSHATETNFQLTFADLDNTEVKAWVMDNNGTFQPKLEGTDFTVNRATGTITFVSAPGETPVSGEDNVKILAYKTNQGYAERINNCTVGALFGVNGAADRLFLSGNINYVNYDWHSEQYLYNYFPDTGYAKLGSDSSAIMGYSIVNNYLAAHKDEDDLAQAVIIREGDLVVNGETSTGDQTIYDQEPAFKIINTLQGAGAICKNSFATLQTEPVFLTRSGIFAITPQDMTGEKYSQNRSFYINEALLSESNLENAYGIVFNDMYLLFINTRVYVLDGLQAVRTDKSEPYSSRQYSAFVLTNIPASIAWIEDNRLWFGTVDGKICQFYDNKEALESYNDDGQPISAWWETGDLDGALFYKKKTFRYIAVRVKANIMTHVTIYARQRGIWTLVKRSKDLSNSIFAFSSVVFSNFTFNNDTSDPVVSSKLRVKKVDKARFKLENSELNEPFGIENLALEFVESGNYKG